MDRNIFGYSFHSVDLRSPSSRRAWIEITTPREAARLRAVALLAEGVDRNLLEGTRWHSDLVALLAEGVDRNYLQSTSYAKAAVALLAEGVDRNRTARNM